jgi:hypothetical protein
MELRPGSKTEFEAHTKLMRTIDPHESNLLWNRDHLD